MKRYALLLLGAGLLFVLSCGAPAGPTPTPAEVAQQSATQMAAVNSFHFIIGVSGKTAFLDSAESMALRRAEGDLVRPDQVRAIAKVTLLAIPAEIGIIGLGDRQYATNPLNQQWEEVPPEARWDLDLASLFDAEQGIAAILQNTAWTFGADDDEYHVLHSGMPAEQLQALTFGLISSGEVEVDFWIGRSDRYVHRIQIVEVESDPETPTTWVIDLSAFDQPVDIQAPPVP